MMMHAGLIIQIDKANSKFKTAILSQVFVITVKHTYLLKEP